MASKSITTTSGKVGAIVKVLAVAGPIAMQVVQHLKDNPDLQRKLMEQGRKLKRQDRSTPEAMLSTLGVLREQVRALADSADDAQETSRVAAWSARLDAATHAAELLRAPGSTAKQRKVLKKQVDGLREEIFAAYVSELDEDARKDAGSAS